MDKEFHVAIHSINLTSLEIYKLTSVPAEKLKTHYDLKGKSSVIPDEKLIAIDTEILVRTDEQNMGKISAIIRFVLRDFEKLIKKGEGEEKFIIPPEIQDRLQLLCISVMRGIMFSEFKGTILNNAILPLMHVKVGETNSIF